MYATLMTTIGIIADGQEEPEVADEQDVESILDDHGADETPTPRWADTPKGASIVDWATASALFVAFAILYWSTRTQYNTFDAVSYANQIAHLYMRTGDK